MKIKILPCSNLFDAYVYLVRCDSITFDFLSCDLFKAQRIKVETRCSRITLFIMHGTYLWAYRTERVSDMAEQKMEQTRVSTLLIS